MSNKEKYNNIFRNVFNIKEEVLNETFNFKDVAAWDSLIHLTLIGELENAFDVILDSDDILHFGGYENGMRILKKYGVDFEN